VENHPYDFTTKGGHCDLGILIINMSKKNTASNHTKPHGQTGECCTPLGAIIYEEKN
jgi:hypothetical protein